MGQSELYSSGWRHLETSLLGVIAPTGTIVLVVFCAVYLPALLSRDFRSVPGKEAIIVSFCVLGAVIGVFVGASKTPVVGTLLPALLTFLTGLLAYLFSKDNLAIWRPIIPLIIVGLVSTALAGAFMGSGIRSDHEAFERKYREWFAKYEAVQLPVEKQQLLNLLKADALKTQETSQEGD